jgi:hypothetical protein
MNKLMLTTAVKAEDKLVSKREKKKKSTARSKIQSAENKPNPKQSKTAKKM